MLPSAIPTLKGHRFWKKVIAHHKMAHKKAAILGQYSNLLSILKNTQWQLQ
jgi:hypothetical protein